jgi:hypothetical protein
MKDEIGEMRKEMRKEMSELKDLMVKLMSKKE